MAHTVTTSSQPTHRFVSTPFILICVATLLLYFAHHLLTPVMPLYLESLGFRGAMVGLLVTILMIAAVVVRPYVGILCDHGYIKHVMTVGAIGFGLSSFLYLTIADGVSLSVVRFLHGMCLAAFVTASTAMVSLIIPQERRTEGLSHYSNAIKLAMATAPALGIWMVEVASIAGTFWVAGFVALSALFCLVPIHIPLALKDGERPSQILFNKRAMFPGLIMATNSICFGAIIPYVPFFSTEKDLSATGWFYGLYAIALILSRFAFGRYADRWNRHTMVLVSMGFVICSLVGLMIAHNDMMFLTAGILYGVGSGPVQPALMAWTAEKTRPTERGSGMATFTMFTTLGTAVGSMIMPILGEGLGYGNSLLVIAAVTFGGFLLLFLQQQQVFSTDRVSSGKV